MWPLSQVAMPADSWPAVLERVEGEVGQPRDVVLGRVDAEDAALVARAVPVWQFGLSGAHGRADVPSRALAACSRN